MLPITPCLSNTQVLSRTVPSSNTNFVSRHVVQRRWTPRPAAGLGNGDLVVEKTGWVDPGHPVNNGLRDPLLMNIAFLKLETSEKVGDDHAVTRPRGASWLKHSHEISDVYDGLAESTDDG